MVTIVKTAIKAAIRSKFCNSGIELVGFGVVEDGDGVDGEAEGGVDCVELGKLVKEGIGEGDVVGGGLEVDANA